MRENESVIETPWKIPRRTGVNFVWAGVASPGILCSDVIADIAEVGDTDVEKQQNIDSTETFPGK